MDRWLKGGDGRIKPEPIFQTEYEEDLLCTPTGQISLSLGGETASTMNMRRLSALAPPRPPISAEQDLDRLKRRIQTDILQLTRYEASSGALRVRTVRVIQQKDYSLTHLSYEAAPGHSVSALLALPNRSAPSARLSYTWTREEQLPPRPETCRNSHRLAIPSWR